MQRQNILSQIEEDISKFHEILSTEKNKFVLEEKILDVLSEIEAKVSQIISGKNGRNILQKEEVFQRYISFNHIESQYTSIDDFLDELISKLSQELNQRKIKLTFDLFERGNSQLDGSGSAKEKIEIKTSQKNKIFLRVLHKMGIDFADVKQFEETLTPERMRKIPYQIYHITSGNIQKTVLISDQIGQASFVYEGIIDPVIFQDVEKGEEIEGHNALKIIYNKKSYEKNLEIALGNKLTFEEKEIQIINEVKEKADGGKEKLTKEQLFKILWNYEGRSEQESYDYFMNFGEEEIIVLEIGGKKIRSIRTFLGIKLDGDVRVPHVFKKLIESIFDGKKINKKDSLSKAEILKLLWNYEGRSEQESYNHFMGLPAIKIKELEIGGKKIRYLRTFLGIETIGNIQCPRVFQEWIEKVFEGKNIVRIEKLTKKQLFQKLWNYEGRSEQASYNHFMGLTQEGIKDLDIGGKKIRSLRTFLGIEFEGNIQSVSIFQEWIEKVFEGKKIVRKNKKQS